MDRVFHRVGDTDTLGVEYPGVCEAVDKWFRSNVKSFKINATNQQGFCGDSGHTRAEVLYGVGSTAAEDVTFVEVFGNKKFMEKEFRGIVEIVCGKKTMDVGICGRNFVRLDPAKVKMMIR
jgi:hypothetical protein